MTKKETDQEKVTQTIKDGLKILYFLQKKKKLGYTIMVLVNPKTGDEKKFKILV